MKKKLKVFYFQSSLGTGGATRSNLKIASGLANNGFDVGFITGNSDVHPGVCTPDSVKHYKLNFSRTIKSILPLVRFIRSEKPDFIISGLIQNNIALALAKIISRSSVKVAFTDRVAPSIEIKNKSGILHKLLPFLMRVFYPVSDCLIAVSCGTAEDVLSIVPSARNKMRVIYNPSVTGEKIAKSYLEFQHMWRNSDLPILLGLGRLEPQKDFLTLLDAFSKVQKDIPSRLIIIGEGSQRAKLEAKISDLNIDTRVDLMGFIPNPHPFLRHADLFVLSSAWEGLPNVLLEAMAYGTSVVSTNCISGPDEILEGGKIAPLVPVGDADAMAESIVRVLKQPQSGEALIKRASMFSEEQSIQRYAELITEVMNESDL